MKIDHINTTRMQGMLISGRNYTYIIHIILYTHTTKTTYIISLYFARFTRTIFIYYNFLKNLSVVCFTLASVDHTSRPGRPKHFGDGGPGV